MQVSKKPSEKTVKRRIFELDLLRGFFILVIIIDHLQFWPSPLGFISGEGRLWVSAAEGFFLISGLLIGYVRVYKGKKYSLKELTVLLWKRALMLYVWGVGVTLLIVSITLSIGGHPLLPDLPSGDVLASPYVYLTTVLSGEYFNSWIYFLRLYAIMLFITPLFIYLLRRGHDLLVVAVIFAAYLLSFWVPEGALQWQVLFFGAALIGYRFESIIGFFQKHTTMKKILSISTIGFSIITIILSGFFSVGWGLIESPGFFMSRETYEGVRLWVDPWFANDPMQIGRMTFAFIWFTGGLLFLNMFRGIIMRLFGWLLIPMGERSLTAYILQALVLPFFVVLIPYTQNNLFNGMVGVVAILFIWWLMQTKIVSKIIPR